ncbi:alpha/beta hydrolase [Streptomyces sp. NPDC052496]|uniref:alpha/beta fold hydrolase n=1 Tax=Streptomyces sp. NPDC052496 TaxID=3154951 RepID=UPI00341BED36
MTTERFLPVPAAPQPPSSAPAGPASTAVEPASVAAGPSSPPSGAVIVQGSGPALVLAHGAGAGVLGNFGLVLDDLAQDHTVIGPHYPGAGGTAAATRPLRLDDLADGLVDAATAAGHASFPVIGESLGCAVALRAATRHPDRITALVLTAGFASADPVLRLNSELIQALGQGGELAAAARLACLSCLSQTELAQLSDAEIDDRVAETLAGLKPALRHFDLVCRVDVHGDLPRITVPTLVVVPTGDRMVLPATTHRLAAGIPGAAFTELPGAGHLMSAGHRAEWLRRVRAFLGAPRPKASPTGSASPTPSSR